MIYQGTIVDIHGRRMFWGEVAIEGERIARIRVLQEGDRGGPYLLSGFVDAHVHIESSMLPPQEFSRLAAVHGTVATVSDPHEIANVLGIEGVRWMLAQGERSVFPIAFGAPSCVPATSFETAGAVLDEDAVAELLADKRIYYLSEVMNFPAVVQRDPGIMAKIVAAHSAHKPVDGHAPGLRGDKALQYASAGITTDHECFTLEEALDKLAAGMHIIIREGSAARNFDTLHWLLDSHPDRVMFCTDDLHPDQLVRGHIDRLVARAVQAGHNVFAVLQAACINPVVHYNLPVGLLREGDRADFITVESLQSFAVLETFIAGKCVARNGNPVIDHHACDTPNRWGAMPVDADLLRLPASSSVVRVIGVRDGQLITDELIMEAPICEGYYCADAERDIALLTVVNRYQPAPAAVALVKGFGLCCGALASSVAHDSHNIVAVGTSPQELACAINALVECKGGIAVCEGEQVEILSLPIAGLMSNADGYSLAAQYEYLDRRAKELGSTLRAPFMTLSFLALLVIPKLKLSDRGLFDGERFAFTSVAV